MVSRVAGTLPALLRRGERPAAGCRSGERETGAEVRRGQNCDEAAVTISLAGTPRSLRETTTGATLQPLPDVPPPPFRRGPPPPVRKSFRTTVPPHSFQVFRIG